jgi:ribosomal protein L40E
VKEHEKVSERERIGQLELVVTEMDTHIQHLHGVLASLQRSPESTEKDDAEVERKPMRDKVWACENCNARLGIYNAESCELRIRYKDFVAYVKPGTGGSTMVPCRRCGEQNKLEDTTAR